MRVVVVEVQKEVLLNPHHQVPWVQVLQDHQGLQVVVVVVGQQAVVAHSNPNLEEDPLGVVGALVQEEDSPYQEAHDGDQGEDLASDSFEEVDHVVVHHVALHEDPHEVHYGAHCGDHHDYQVPDDLGDLEGPLEDQEEPEPSNWVVAAAADHSE